MLPPVPKSGSTKELERHVVKLQNYIESITGDNKTIQVSKTGAITVSAIPQMGKGGNSVNTYKGAWAIIQKNANTVTIKAQDTANGYLCKSLMIAGLTTKEQTTDADVTITTTGAVYIQITQSGGTYSFTFANVAALPAQTAGNLYVALAYVTFASSAITGLQQAQYGQIHVAGRIV